MIQNKNSIKIESVVKALTYAIAIIGFLSVVKYIGILYSLSFVSLYLFSLYLESRKRFLMPRWFLNILSLSVVISAFLRIDADDPVVVVVEALLILAGIKFLEEKRFRDHMQVYLITMLLLTGSALLSIDIIFLFYFISLTFLLAVAIVMLTYYSQDRSMELKTDTLLRITSKSLLIPLLSIPMTVFMFIILPRTNYPLLSFLNRGTVATSGFTDNVSLGSISTIQVDETVILRAHMDRVGEGSLYWRGIVLDFFDGASWKRMHTGGADNQRPATVSGKHVAQTIYLEPYENRYLFALDKPVSVSLKNAKKSADLSYFLPGGINKRIRYYSTSVLSGVLAEDKIDKNIYLKLPDRNIDRIKGLVKSLSASTNKEETIKRFLNFLRNSSFSYSLKHLPLSDSPLEDFLFKHKYGNCEYFASAMAVMLRAAGVPSRIVGGYRGGYYNEAGNYYLVSQKNAHVWVEAYIDNKGWVRLDPTPAGIENFISPERKSLSFRVKLLLDTVLYHWNAIIINYDFTKQMSLLHKLRAGIKNPAINLAIKKEVLIRYSAVLLSIALCCAVLYHIIFNRKTPEEKILGLFLRKMGECGFKKSKSEGLEEFVSKIGDKQLKEKAHTFVSEFEACFYRDKKLSRKDMLKLKQILEN